MRTAAGPGSAGGNPLGSLGVSVVQPGIRRRPASSSPTPSTRPDLRELPIPNTLLELEGNDLFNYNPAVPDLGWGVKLDLPPGPYTWTGNSFKKDAAGNYRFVYDGRDALSDQALWDAAPIEPKTSPNPLKNDKEFLPQFPYLAEP